MNCSDSNRDLFLELRRQSKSIRDLRAEQSTIRRNGDFVAGTSGITVRKNSSITDVGTQTRVNAIEGTGILITALDDPVGGEIDLTFAVNAILAALSIVGFEVYFGGAPSVSGTVPQLWWDTATNPWELKTNLKNISGTAQWVTVIRGLE